MQKVLLVGVEKPGLGGEVGDVGRVLRGLARYVLVTSLEDSVFSFELCDLFIIL